MGGFRCQSGRANPNWRGGRSVASHGYVLVRVGQHHHLADVRGYAYEHRLVAERKIGRRLEADEKVHHINGVKTDNRPENLEVVSGNAEHFFLHRRAGSNRQKPGEPNPIVPCACGCGQTFRRFEAGRPRIYVSGHNRRAGRRYWTAEEERQLRELYPNTATKALAKMFGVRVVQVYAKAARLGLDKSEAYLASPEACRLRRGDQVGKAHRFKKGHVPANKGLRRPPGWGPGRMKETQFKKGVRQGVAVRLWKPIGTERISRDGYLERKVNDDLPPQRRWRAVHLIVWEAANGPVPRGHVVVFTNGDKRDVRLENLDLISRRELMRRNTVHNLPKPLVEVIQLRGALQRQINKRDRRAKEQDRGSAEPSVRDARGVEGQRRSDGDRSSQGRR